MPRLHACCVRLLRARAAACSVSSASLLLVVSLLLLAGAAASAAAAAAVKFCVQPTAAAFPLLLPARGQALAGAGFSSEGAAANARKKPSRYVAARLCALCFGATYARVLCARHYFSIFIAWQGFAAHNARARITHSRAVAFLRACCHQSTR